MHKKFLGYIFEKIVPKLVTGVVGVILYPIVLAGMSNLYTPRQTIAIVSRLEQHADVTKIRFQKVGLNAFEGGLLGTRRNPILTRGTFFVLPQVNLSHSLPENRLMGETLSHPEQEVESSLALSELSESVSLSDALDSEPKNRRLGETLSHPEQEVESSLALSELSESVALSDDIDSEDSEDFPAITQESLDLEILRKKNFTQVKWKAMSHTWAEIYKTSDREPSLDGFVISQNDCYQQNAAENHASDESEDREPSLDGFVISQNDCYQQNAAENHASDESEDNETPHV